MKRDFALTVKAIIIREDKFLVLRRSVDEIKYSYMNKREVWDLPGGGVKFYETAEHGLFREIHEETGIKVCLKKVLNIYDAIKSNIHMTIITYVCEYLDGEIKLSDEHEAYYWLNINEMEEMKLPHWMIRDFRTVYDEYFGTNN